MRKKAIVYADISGHYVPLVSSMEKFDATPTHIPNDVHLIFAGDTIHRGPQSEKIIVMLDGLKKSFPSNITILAGNHEANYIKSAHNKFMWAPEIDNKSSNIINGWWEDGLMRLGAGVISDDGNMLATHAGLSLGFWQFLGSPVTLQDTVKALDDLQMSNSKNIWSSGVMLTGRYNHYAGPIWAEGANEVIAPWMNSEIMGEAPKFGQIFGHSQPYNFSAKTWNIDSELMRGRFHINTKKRWCRCIIGSQLFVGCDPGHGRNPVKYWEPYVFNNARILENVSQKYV